MQVDAGNYGEFLRDFSARLPASQYVSVDFELTGVSVGNEPDDYADTPCERLEKSCRIADGFAPIQLGLTLMRRQPGETQHLMSYNIIVAPESCFVGDISALKFGRKHGVDLNAWIDRGVRRNEMDNVAMDKNALTRLQAAATDASLLIRASTLHAFRKRGFDFNSWVDETNTPLQVSADSNIFWQDKITSAREKCPEGGLTRLWRLLQEAKKPLLVHGHLDVFFLLSAFELRPKGHFLPRDPVLFAQLAKRCFPHGIYDTSTLHESIPALRVVPLNLKKFFQWIIQKLQQRHPNFTIRFEAETKERYQNGSLAHEAGYDSMLTAIVFECMCQLYGKPQLKYCSNRLYLYNSVDCLNLGAHAASEIASTIYCDELETLLVAELTTQDAIEMTAVRISRAAKLDPSFYYRKMDKEHLLVVILHGGEPAIETAKELSRKLPGVAWFSFNRWRKKARAAKKPQPDFATTSTPFNPRGSKIFTGSIKNFSSEKGYGFINCPEAKRTHGTAHVFLHWRQMTGFEVGQHVAFMITENHDGKPQARDLEAIRYGACDHGSLGQSLQRLPPHVVQNPMACEEPVPSMQAARQIHALSDYVHLHADGRTPSTSSGRQVGIVKSYSPSSNYGFIQVDPITLPASVSNVGDVYVCSSQLVRCSMLTARDCVEFDLVFDQRGRPQAHDVIHVPINNKEFSNLEMPYGNNVNLGPCGSCWPGTPMSRSRLGSLDTTSRLSPMTTFAPVSATSFFSVKADGTAAPGSHRSTSADSSSRIESVDGGIMTAGVLQ
mmetsp:Transcript_13871/g.37722  ORF Transcript_13871/g.37722 Transcript_13871/m.37722 type:complete len:779 (+) Transcript_13871:67-2403(+)